MYGNWRIGLDVSDRGEHAWQSFTAERTARVVAKHPVEKRQRIEPVTDAARVIKIILDWTAAAWLRLRFIPDRKSLACAFLLFLSGVMSDAIAEALLLGPIDNARWTVRSAIALRLAMVTIIDCEFGLQQCDREDFAIPLLWRASAGRA